MANTYSCLRSSSLLVLLCLSRLASGVLLPADSHHARNRAAVDPNIKETCNITQMADILFILDSSGSIGQTNFDIMLDFVANLTKNFNLGPTAIQFAAVEFGTDAQEVFNFKTYTTQLALQQGILGIKYLAGGSTGTDLALQLARQTMFTPLRGARVAVPKIAIVLTDGLSNNATLTRQQAELLKRSGVLVMSIGIGTGVNVQELLNIASFPEDMFTVSNFNVLATIQKEVTNRTCQQVITPPVITEAVACQVQADIIFILDASASVLRSDFLKELSFVANLTRSFQLGPVQFASVVFSNQAQAVFNFSKHWNHASLEEDILRTPYLMGVTNTSAALKFVREQMFTVAQGARPNVARHVIVLTNGISANSLDLAEQARLLKSSGVSVLAVGIGSGPSLPELQTIASMPGDVFLASNATLLDNLRGKITNRTCEKVTGPLTACDAQADILFLVDSSASISMSSYNTLLNFMVNLTRNFEIGPTKIQFGSIAFSDEAVEVFDFRQYSNQSALEEGILSTPYLQGSTYTNKALQLARESMFTAAKGSRPNVSKIVIVLTDGQSTRPADTATQARLLKNVGAIILSIGIGDSVNQQELEMIASLPHDVFQVSDFEVLNTILLEVTNKTCERVNDEKPRCPAVADVLLVIDSTGSIGKDNYNTILHFLANFTRNFALGPNWVQFSSIIFGDQAYSEFSFTDYNTHSTLEEAILNSTYLDETTQTDLALKMAREKSFTLTNGARPGVDKIVVVLTDGRSNDPDLTAQEAQLLKKSGVLVITVAIGVDVSNKELNAIATLPDDVFHVEHFDALEALQNEFSHQVCDRVRESVECEAQADILLLLDSSASIGSLNYNKMLNFAINLTRAFELGSNAVQFSAIIFGDDAHLVFDFGEYNNHPSLEQAVLGIPYLGQDTFTNTALMLARLQAFTQLHGSRTNVSRIAIVFTDGQSSSPTETTREAQLLKDLGVLILSVGIGDTVKESELEAIASLPEDVFHVNNFDVLSTVQKALTRKTCDKVTGSGSACSKRADIIFLLDASGSVSIEDYRQELIFAANFTNNFQIGPDDALFGAVIFSDTAIKLFDLNDLSDHWSILQSLLAAPHLKGGTNTAQALNVILNDGLFDVRNGGRTNATKMLFIMTDGQSANISQSVTAAQQLKNQGVHITTIGVGSVVNKQELLNMASSPADMFLASSFEVLNQLQQEVTNHTCGFSKPITSGTHRACSEPADIIFVMDSSSSITPAEYEKQLLFASNLTLEFDVGPEDARFGSLVFSNDVFKVFDLESHSNHATLYNGLLSSPHLTGATDTAKALNWISDMRIFDPTFGGRGNISKIVVLFVDNPSVDTAETIRAATRLKNSGVHITVIGVDSYDLYEIRKVASDPQSAFKATSFDTLHWIQRELVDDICDFASRAING